MSNFPWVCRYSCLHVTVCRYSCLNVTVCRYSCLNVMVCRYSYLNVTVCRYSCLNVTVWRYSCLNLARTDPMEEVTLAKSMNMIFQHDEAPAHYSRLVTHHLNLTFPERRVDRDGHVQWPPRSPDLTPLDCCLWGWMKSEVDKEKVNTRDELVARIMNSAAL
jgi:hypothetical protein